MFVCQTDKHAMYKSVSTAFKCDNEYYKYVRVQLKTAKTILQCCVFYCLARATGSLSFNIVCDKNNISQLLFSFLFTMVPEFNPWTDFITFINACLKNYVYYTFRYLYYQHTFIIFIFILQSEWMYSLKRKLTHFRSSWVIY